MLYVLAYFLVVAAFLTAARLTNIRMFYLIAAALTLMLAMVVDVAW